MGGLNNLHGDMYGNNSRDSTLMMREVSVLSLFAPAVNHMLLHQVNEKLIAFSRLMTKIVTGSSTHTPFDKAPFHLLSPAPHLPITPALPAPLSVFFQRRGERRRRSSTASNGVFGIANLFADASNLPDLVQQSPSPHVAPGDAPGAQVGFVDETKHLLVNPDDPSR